jgi:type II secretory pathway component PulF
MNEIQIENYIRNWEKSSYTIIDILSILENYFIVIFIIIILLYLYKYFINKKSKITYKLLNIILGIWIILYILLDISKWYISII